MKNRSVEMLFAGFGGQGIMFMGKILALAGLAAGKYVTWMPSYGAEVRGGTAYSMTKVSDLPIANPIVAAPDILVAMNKPSLLKYEGAVKEGGIIIANTSLIDTVSRKKGRSLIAIPLTKIAADLGDARCANMIAVGALVKRSKVMPLKDVVGALRETFKAQQNLAALNTKALEEGYRHG